MVVVNGSYDSAYHYVNGGDVPANVPGIVSGGIAVNTLATVDMDVPSASVRASFQLNGLSIRLAELPGDTPGAAEQRTVVKERFRPRRIMPQLSMIALWANGLRPTRSQPGHHQTKIQSFKSDLTE